MFGTFKGQADGEHFYFSKNGHVSLADEAKASTKAFLQKFKGTNPNLHPQCRFPERYRYLKEKLNLKVKNAFCPDYSKWIKDLDPVGLSLSYAANYPDNPGSVMGHTFLRIISRKSSRLQRGSTGGKHLDLLDYSISYAASTKVSTGVLYAFKGLFGGYQGLYSLQPYYMKVREYSEGDGRNLWEYDLNVTEEGTRRMMAHFWEVSKNTFFYYYFMSENCSFHLLTLLEVANPKFNLTKDFFLYTVPYDTVKALSFTPNAIKSIKFRPSRITLLKSQFEQLKGNSKKDFKKVLNGEKSLDIYKDDYKFLEVLSSYLFYERVENELTWEPEKLKLYKKALKYRAGLGKQKPLLKMTPPLAEGPHNGHDTSLVRISHGYSNHKNYQKINLKAGLHDLLNKDAGFAKFSKLDSLDLQLKYGKDEFNKRKLSYEYFTFLDILSLIPVTEYSTPFSWGAEIKHKKSVDLGRKSSLSFLPSYGLSFSFLKDRALLFVLGQMNLEFASNKVLKNNTRFGPGAIVGLVSEIGTFGKVFLSSQIRSDLLQNDREKWRSVHTLDFSFFTSRTTDLRIGGKRFIRGEKSGTNRTQLEIGFGVTL